MNGAVAIELSPSLSGPVLWAAEELRRALTQAGRAASIGGATGETIIRVSAPSGENGSEESFEIAGSPSEITVSAGGTRGLVYALTELADRARYPGDTPFPGALPHIETPALAVRSVCRAYSSDIEDRAWFYDREQWRDYLTMLAENRFNRFSLALGFGYNYPYHNPWVTDVYFYFPYPFLLEMPGYGITVKELSPEERAENLAMLKFIGEEAARRGLDFQLALWTQRYDFEDSPRANFTVEGVTADNLAPYCRDAVATLLKEVPQITGLTFRIHVEGGIGEGEYDFWRTLFDGVKSVGRPVEIDMHGKGLDHTVLQIARETGMPFAASPKFMAEHMGLPYHQSAIREREYPPETARSAREKLSEGSRKFLRYSYGDLLTHDKDYKVINRIWPGTQRVLLWGDAEFAAGYSRTSAFGGSDGIEVFEPLTFKGRMATGIAGGRFNYRRAGLSGRYDFEKYRYYFRVWGRNLANPSLSRDDRLRFLSERCGTAAEACEAALATASRVLPLVTLAHGPSVSNNFYWPEIYSNLPVLDDFGGHAYYRDMTGPHRFGNAPTLDSELFANAREYAADLLAGRAIHRYTPLDVALWLDDLAEETEAACRAIAAAADAARPEAERMRGDAEISAGLARFFAAKFRAACWAELYIESEASVLFGRIVDEVRRGVAAWEALSAISARYYHDDLSYGPQTWLRGSWHTRLPEIRAELDDLEAARSEGRLNTLAPSEAVKAAIAAIEDYRPVEAERMPSLPESFEPGKAVDIRVRDAGVAEPVLHYRRVDQSQRWNAVPMRASGDGYVAEIPADYTGSKFHLQYFLSYGRDGGRVLSPGLEGKLSNDPYYVALQ